MKKLKSFTFAKLPRASSKKALAATIEQSLLPLDSATVKGMGIHDYKKKVLIKKKSPFETKAQIRQDKLERFILHSFEQDQRRISKITVSEMIRKFNGHCGHILSLCNWLFHSRRKVITSKVVQEAITDLSNSYGWHIEELLTSLSKRHQRILFELG